MRQLTLFVSPGTCARVPTIALEEIGVPFETEIVRMRAKQNRTPEFLAKNPKGKVPTLLIDGEPLTENIAINMWLHEAYPEARLLPETNNRLERLRQTADLSFFAAMVHPIVSRIGLPERFSDGPNAFTDVRASAINAMRPVMTLISDRIGPKGWWYGDNWSIVDGYLFWAWWRISASGFPRDEFPNICAHAERCGSRPSVVRAMEREAGYIEQLKSEGLYRAPR